MTGQLLTVRGVTYNVALTNFTPSCRSPRIDTLLSTAEPPPISRSPRINALSSMAEPPPISRSPRINAPTGEPAPTHTITHQFPVGAPPTIVLLHGFTGSTANWEQQATIYADAGLRVIAIDMLGHGQSAAPNDPRRYSIEECCSDILALLQQLGVQPGEAVLLGYSMGGRIALYTAFSGYFRAVILESASPGLAHEAERAARRASDAALAARIEQEGIAAFVAYWENIPLFASQHALPAKVRAALHAQRLHNRAHGLANSLRGIGTGAQSPLHDRLPQLAVPILLIAGAADAKYTAIARTMAQSLPNAVLHIVPSAGHTVHLEQPTRFAELVLDFCQRLTTIEVVPFVEAIPSHSNKQEEDCYASRMEESL